MKPTFALDLTREEIALLHRTPKGWLSIGEVAFDAPDLAETLDYLRKTALGLSPMGMACKIVLPNSQILYAEVHAPGPSRDEKRRQIAAALEGRTPYAVEDLVFDWSGKGQTVKVAVVARETLEEAESFAVTHRLNPVSFVAVPAAGEFVGEPWFGPTVVAEAILAPGESVDRDREPVAILQRDLPSGAPTPPEVETVDADPAPEPGPEAAPEPVAPVAEAPVAPPPVAEDDEPLPGLEEALNAELPLPELVDPAHVPLPPLGAVDDSLDDLDEAALAAALGGGPQEAPAPAVSLALKNEAAAEASRPEPAPDRAPMPGALLPDAHDLVTVAEAWEPEPPLPSRADPAPAESEPVAEVSSEPAAADPQPSSEEAPAAAVTKVIAAAADPDEAPFAEVLDALALDEDAARPEAGQHPAAAPTAATSVLDDDLPPAPPAAALVAFASRRAAGAARPAPASAPGVNATPTALPGASAPTPASPVGTNPGAANPIAASQSGRAALPPRPTPAPRSFPGLVTAPTIPGTRPRPKGKTGLSEPALAAASIAGTRPLPAKSPSRPGGTFGAAPARNRSGVALLVLVGLLLLFLASIAAVSSYFLSRNGSPAVDSAGLSDPVALVPGIEDEMLADMQDPEGMTDPLPEAEGPALAAGDAGVLATESLVLVPVEEVPPEAAVVAPVDPVDLAAPAADDTPAAPAAEDGPAAPGVTVIAAPETARAVAPVAETAATPAAASVADQPTEPAPETVVATDVSAATAPVEDQDEIFLAAMDAPPPALDALALPAPDPVTDSAPPAPLPPPAFGTVYRFDDQGLLVPTAEGILSPEGVMLFAGPPPLVPPTRSDVAAAAARAAAALAPQLATDGVADALSEAIGETPEAPALDVTVTPADASLVAARPDTAVAPEPVAPDALAEDGAQSAPADPALSGFRPRPRPAGLVPVPDDDAALDGAATSDFASIRPLGRPQVVLAAAAAANPGGATADLGAQAASLTAQAEADLAAAAALEAANPSIIAISRRPEPRPTDLSRAVEAAVAAAVRDPEPEVVAAAADAPDLKPEEIDELDEPLAADAGPSIPTNASVAKQATFKNAINLSKMNLIGTYGTDSRRTALIRQSNGRYKEVEVGDKIDGGTIMAITEGEVRYQKGGKLLTLAMPKA